MIRKYLKINRSYVLMSLAGILISIIILSQIILLSTNYQQRSFDNFLENIDTPSFVFEGEAGYDSSQFNFWKYHMNTIDNVLGEFQQLDKSSNLQYMGNIVTGGIIEDRTSKGDSKQILTTSIEIKEYQNDDYLFYSKFNEFTFNNSENILIIPPEYVKSDLSPIIENNIIELVVGETFTKNLQVEFNRTGIHIDRILQLDRKNIANYYNNFPTDFNDYRLKLKLLLNDKQLIDTKKYFWNFIENNPNISPGLTPIFRSLVYISLPNLIEVELQELINKLERLSNDISSWVDTFKKSQNYPIWIDFQSPLIKSLYHYQEQIKGMNGVTFLLSSPLLTLSLFLVYLSVSIVQRRKERIISILRMRGTSDMQLRFILLEEVVLSSSISVISGMFLSIPWISHILNTAVDPTMFLIPDRWFWLLPIGGVVLSIDLQMPNIIYLSNITVDTAFNERISKKPIWKRYFIDILIFGICFPIMLIIPYLPNSVELSVSILMGTPILLFLFFIGAPLFLTRIFEIFARVGFSYHWNKFGTIHSLYVKRILGSRNSIFKLFTFLILANLLSFSTLGIQDNMEDWSMRNAYYKTGADIVIKGIDINNISKIGEVQGVKSYTEVLKIRLTISSTKIQGVQILAINSSTFFSTAYWIDDFSETNKNNLTSAIQNNLMLFQSNYMKSLNYNIGDTINFDIQGENNSTNLYFQIGGEFLYFPNLVDIDPEISTDTYMVMNIADTDDLPKSDTEFMVYIKLENGANLKQVCLELQNLFGESSEQSILTVQDVYLEFVSVPTLQMMMAIIQPIQIMTLLSLLIAIGYHSMITINEKKSEIGILRALGMIQVQLIQYLLWEILLIVVFSLLVGLLFSPMVGNIFFIYLKELISTNQGLIVLPMELQYQIRHFFRYFGLIFILTIIFSIVPARILAKTKIQIILRSV